MSKHECDCGVVYSHPDLLNQCAASDHGGETSDRTTRYERFVADIWRDGQASTGVLSPKGLLVCGLGLAGENGETLEPIKKWVRRHMVEGSAVLPDPALADREALVLEMGDVLYYLTRLGQNWGITLREMMDGNERKLGERYASGRKRNTKEEAQHLLAVLEKHEQERGAAYTLPLDVRESLGRLRELTK